MITLQKLRWSNCFSYGENNELDFLVILLLNLLELTGWGNPPSR